MKSRFTKMLSLTLTIVMVFSVQNLCLAQESKEATKSTIIKEKVQALLDKMSIEEKVGQMTQVNLNVILDGEYNNTDGSIDTVLLKEAVVDYKVGSILNAINNPYSVDKWHEIITKIQDQSKNTPNQIPVLYGIDAIHGANYTSESTLFPHNIGIAATRNPSIAKEGAKITALEVRASGIRWNFDPVLDIGRQPLWPRFPETYGEDPYMIKTMAVATVEGYEEDGLNSTTSVASTMKHYVGYSHPRTGKDRTPAYIPDIELREYHLPQFQAAIDAGASTVMINSGSVNNIPVHANRHLLVDILRTEMGFEGLAVSDWEDIIRLHTKHRVAETPKEAVRIAVIAGIDMSMVPHDYSFFELLVELVKEGAVPMSRIDEAVGRILTLKFRTGLFDNPYPETEAIANFGKPEFKEAALKAARESITLLKNTANILPLARDKKILVAGPGAKSITSLNGAWSYTWQGDNEDLYPSSYKTIYQAIVEKAGKDNVVSTSYTNFERKENYQVNALIEAAKKVDYIILCLGENAYAESPGVIDDLTLDARQLKLAKAAYSTGKPVIIILTEGRPRIISDIEQDAKGILQAYWPGSQGGPAIADVIYGDYNPSGKLPYTYPKYTGSIVMYDYKYSELLQELAPGSLTETGYQPQWPFGFGLSYTTFEYSDIALSSEELKGNDSIEVSITVKNTGDKDGDISIDLFTRDLFASIVPSMKRLRAFTKVSLEKGESKKVTFQLTKEDLAFAKDGTTFVTEEGDFEVMIEDKVAKFRYME